MGGKHLEKRDMSNHTGDGADRGEKMVVVKR